MPSGDAVTAIATSPSLKLINFILLVLDLFKLIGEHDWTKPTSTMILKDSTASSIKE